MSRSFDADDLASLAEIFAEDLRSAFPEAELPERVVQDHVAAMISVAQLLAEEGATVMEPAGHPGPEGLMTPRRTWMRTGLIRRAVTLAAGLLLSLTGLAFAGAFEGSDDTGNYHTTAIVSHQTDDDQGEDGDEQGDNENTDDQIENSDDQGEDADDQDEDADDQSDNENAVDDQGDNQNANDDQGDNENADDDQGDNQNANDDQGDNENADDDQGDGGDSQD